MRSRIVKRHQILLPERVRLLLRHRFEVRAVVLRRLDERIERVVQERAHVVRALGRFLALLGAQTVLQILRKRAPRKLLETARAHHRRVAVQPVRERFSDLRLRPRARASVQQRRRLRRTHQRERAARGDAQEGLRRARGRAQ